MDKVTCRKYRILVPTAWNDGTPINPRLLDGVRDDLLKSLGGYTEEPPVVEFYRGMNGTAAERMLPFVVCVKDTPLELEKLRIYAQQLCERFAQECVYLERGGEVDFVFA